MHQHRPSWRRRNLETAVRICSTSIVSQSSTLVDRDLVLYDSRVIMSTLDERLSTSPHDACSTRGPRRNSALAALFVSHFDARLVPLVTADRQGPRQEEQQSIEENPARHRVLQSTEIFRSRRTSCRRNFHGGCAIARVVAPAVL